MYPQNPQQPKKKHHPAKIAGLGCLGALVLLFLIGLIGSIVAPIEDDDTDTASPAPTTATPEPSAKPTEGTAGKPSQAPPTSALPSWPDAGVPPTPDAANWADFINGLNAIDPEIVHGKEEKAIDRGRNQCSSVRQDPDNEAKLIDLTNQGFTSPGHPEGFGPAKAAQILDLVRKHICPGI